MYYFSIATQEDGYVIIHRHIIIVKICLNDIDSDGVCDELEIFGCTDESACNYDSTATEDDGICEYTTYYNCQGECLNDVDLDGVCNSQFSDALILLQ